MLNVIFSVDVEVWCGDWNRIEEQFPEAFKRYIYGHTQKGDYGLPIQLEVLNDYGLRGVFFVEPLFARRFSEQPLQEIVGLIHNGNQEIQLHLHPEWVDESIVPIIPGPRHKRQFMANYTLAEQKQLIKTGMEMMKRCGCDSIKAFRAGGFAANNDTLKALCANDLVIDSSYNYAYLGKTCDIRCNKRLNQPYAIEGIFEYPITNFSDYPGHFRHAQLAACSSGELIAMLRQALHLGLNSFVILSHGFELLDQSKSRVNKVVFDRFIKLCKFLDNNRGDYNCVGFSDIEPESTNQPDKSLSSNVMRTVIRMIEQKIRS